MANLLKVYLLPVAIIISEGPFPTHVGRKRESALNS